jgi:hypothetical protein
MRRASADGGPTGPLRIRSERYVTWPPPGSAVPPSGATIHPMRRFAAILALVLGLTLLAAPPASAAVAAHAENRASGSAAGLTTLIGIEARLSEEAVRENAGLGYDIASDDAVAARGTLRGGAQAGGISAGEAQRIQNAANRIGKPIDVVGGRARGKTTGDYDYVIDANAKTRNSAGRSLPGAGNVSEGVRPNIDVFKGPVDPARPSIRFEPEGP